MLFAHLRSQLETNTKKTREKNQHYLTLFQSSIYPSSVVYRDCYRSCFYIKKLRNSFDEPLYNFSIFSNAFGKSKVVIFQIFFFYQTKSLLAGFPPWNFRHWFSKEKNRSKNNLQCVDCRPLTKAKIHSNRPLPFPTMQWLQHEGHILMSWA